MYLQVNRTMSAILHLTEMEVVPCQLSHLTRKTLISLAA